MADTPTAIRGHRHRLRKRPIFTPTNTQMTTDSRKWGASDDIRPAPTEEDGTGESFREAYDYPLASKPVDESIEAAVARLRALVATDLGS